MGGIGKRVTSGSGSSAATSSGLHPPSTPRSQPSMQHMYFLEGGLLVANNLLKTDAWVNDEERTHCNVCVQQFLPFRRRHHCRTCGEVVCGGCSSQRTIRLTDVNVECATRICTYCIIHATDASIRVNETALRESAAAARKGAKSTVESFVHPVLGNPSLSSGKSYLTSQSTQQHQNQQKYEPMTPPHSGNHLSVFSMDSALTDGSVVQLWPQPEPDGESARLKIARHSNICSRENDPTMNLLVSIISRTLECPVAFIGILDETRLWFKASVGWTRPCLPRNDCVAAHTLAQAKTLIVNDTLHDKHFHASDLRIDGHPMRFYAGAPIWVSGQCIGAVCAIDIVPHESTSTAKTSTLESVAKIVSEVLEERIGSIGAHEEGAENTVRGTLVPMTGFFSASLLAAMEEEGVCSAGGNQVVEQKENAFGNVRDRNSTKTQQHRLGTSPSLASFANRDSESQWDSTQDSRRSYYVTLPQIPDEYSEKISLAIDTFHQLQSSSWSERRADMQAHRFLGKFRCDISDNNRGSGRSGTSSTSDSTYSDGSVAVKTFEVVQGGQLFTRTNIRLAGDCTDILTQLLNYEDARIYQHLFSQVTRRYKLNEMTWMDQMMFRPGVLAQDGEQVCVLSHWRQYPDGSNVIVAVNGDNLNHADENDLLFSWFVAPCVLDNGSLFVNVSCMVAQPYTNQCTDQNLSLDLALHVNFSAPASFKLSPSAAVSPATISSARKSNDNQHTHEESRSTVMSGINRRSSTASFSDESTSFPVSNCAEIVTLQQTGQIARLNENERMMLDLLDKTISTQEILAAQQSEMAGVIDLHGAQLQRISTAIERVENLLADKVTRRQGCPSTTSRHSFN